MHRWGICLATLAGALAWPGAAQAHALFQRYDLPVPLGLYLAGAGASVALSFVVMGWFLRGAPLVHDYPRVNLRRWRVGRALAHPSLIVLGQAASVGLFVLVVVAGLFGTQNPFKNFAPAFVWVIWWIGLAYLCTLVGNVWALINPWRITFAWAEAVARGLGPGRKLSLGLATPRWLGVWPAVALFLAFAWMELVWDGSEVPAQLASAILLYSLLTWTGMLVFGREEWLRAGEAFSVIFGLLARFGPTEVRVRDPAVCAACSAGQCRERPGACVDCYACFARAAPEDREWNLRPYAVGLLARRPVAPSTMVFVVLMLSTVTFDGFIETPLWLATQDWLLASPALRPLLIEVRALAGDLVPVFESVALVILPLVFLGCFLLFSELMRRAAPAAAPAAEATAPGNPGGRIGLGEVARLFVLSLVPIAIAYHLAHYLWFFLVAGQFIIPLASDPFGSGWDILGWSNYRIDVGIVGARFVWYTAVAAIVVGHIIAVFLAHVVALRVFADRRMALRSQYPMLVLMVGYTMISLWILAQPVVESGA